MKFSSGIFQQLTCSYSYDYDAFYIIRKTSDGGAFRVKDSHFFSHLTENFVLFDIFVGEFNQFKTSWFKFWSMENSVNSKIVADADSIRNNVS